MKNKFLIIALFGITSLSTTLVSCTNDDPIEVVNNTPSKVTLKLDGENISSIKNITLSFKEANSGEITTIETNTLTTEITLKKGSYTITANGIVILTSGEEMQAGGTATLDVINDDVNATVSLNIKIFSNDFIIEEVFFTGVQTTEGKAYNSGKYFKLTNNTDKVLNTGGLLIMKSELNPTANNDITPDIRTTDFAVSGVLMITQENAKEVQPGDFIIIADMAMNHKTTNIPAFDLSKADYEFPNLDNTALGQVDNPAVPDAKVIYSTMNYNMFLLHNRGFESYAIARFPQGETTESWLANYKYDYEYPNAAGTVTKKSVYKIPNSWIIDGVNCAVEAKWQHNPLAASIDSGWTGCGTIDSDPARFGKTIRRKVIGKLENGKNLYKDTNNSTEDFTKTATSSIENGIIH